MAKINSKQKGKRGELEAVNWFKARGLHAERSQQYKGNADASDIKIKDLPKYHMEIKRTEKLSLYTAIEQATKDAETLTPVVMHRRSKQDWLVIMRAEDWLEVVKRAEGITA